MKCYLAGGWFKEHQTEFLEKVYNFIKSQTKWQVHCPYKEPNCNASSTLQLQKQIYEKNLDEIQKCDIFVACVTEDSGTIWEIGYARALNKKVFLLTNENEKQPEINLMLYMSADFICDYNDKKRLSDILHILEKPDYYSIL